MSIKKGSFKNGKMTINVGKFNRGIYLMKIDNKIQRFVVN